MKKPSKAQQWQRKRFQAKGSICATIGLLKKLQELNILTITEKYCATRCIYFLESAIKDWKADNAASKRKYLSLHK